MEKYTLSIANQLPKSCSKDEQKRSINNWLTNFANIAKALNIILSQRDFKCFLFEAYNIYAHKHAHISSCNIQASHSYKANTIYE